MCNDDISDFVKVRDAVKSLLTVDRPAEYSCFIEAVYRYAGDESVRLMSDKATQGKVDDLNKKLRNNNLIARKIPKYEIKAMAAGLAVYKTDEEITDEEYGKLTSIQEWKKCVKSKKKIIDRSMCILTYFLIVDNIAADDPDERKNLFRDIMHAAGIPYSPVAIPDMETAILYYIIGAGRPCDDYITLMNDWDKVKESYTPDLILDYPENLDDMTCNRLEEIVEKGYDNIDDIRRTRMSVNMINDALKQRIEQKSNKYTVEDVFEDDTIRMILDSATRRKWYMLKMLFLIVDSQINVLLDASYDRHKIERMAHMLWLNGRKTDIGGPITWNDLQNPTKEKWDDINKDDLEDFLRDLCIAPEKVGKWMFWVTNHGLLDPAEGNDIHMPDYERQSFFTYEQLRKIDNDEGVKDSENNRANANVIRSLLTGTCSDVTREFLIFMYLICLLYGAAFDDEDYLTTHILPNSRLPEDMDSTFNPFDRYYELAKKELSSARSFDDRYMRFFGISEALEEYYYENNEISVFYDIMHRKNIDVNLEEV